MEDDERPPVPKCGLKPGAFEDLMRRLIADELLPADRVTLLYLMGLAMGQELRLGELEARLAAVGKP